MEYNLQKAKSVCCTSEANTITKIKHTSIKEVIFLCDPKEYTEIKKADLSLV